MRIERLARLYNDPGPFATAYVEVSRDQEDGNHVADLHVRGVGDDLVRQGAPASVVELLTDRLSATAHEPGPVSRCVVATERGVLLDQLTRSHRPQTIATWGPLPDLGCWLADASQTVPFVLALVDHEGGTVTTYSADLMEVVEESDVGKPSVYEHKTRGGGWSHYRRQRTAEEVWNRNADEVAAEIERQVQTGPDLVLLAGDVQSHQRVVNQLPDSWSAEVVVLERGGRAVDGGDDALAAEVESVLKGQVVATHLQSVHDLRDRLGQAESVTIGVADVADTFVRGQVDRLLIDPDRAAEYIIHPQDHPGLVLGTTMIDGKVRADQALIAAACLTGAEVVIARASTMGEAPAAALLRWNQTALDTRG
jgi:hypothetical protein